MRSIKIKSVHSVKDLGVTVASNLKFSLQCNESVKKANRTMGVIQGNFSFKKKMYYLCMIVSLGFIWSLPFSFSFPTLRKTLLN